MEIYELDMNQYHFNHLSLIRFPGAAGAQRSRQWVGDGNTPWAGHQSIPGD